MARPLPWRAYGALRWRAGKALRYGADRLATLGHDLAAPGRLRVTAGALPFARKAAVYLIFPTGGLLASHRLALAHLVAAGYAPLVVSNLPLAAADRADLAARAWRVIERPNFGYDFGGYRDGLRHLGPRLSGLARLVLANDSVWFPIPGSGDFLARAEATGADLAGAVSNLGVAPPEPDALDAFRWRFDPGRDDFHYCSFLLSLGPRAVADPGMRAFWRRLALSDRKRDTVQRAEVGLTRRARARGLTHAATFDVAGLDRAVAALTPERFRAVLAGLVQPEDPPLRAEKAAVLARPDGSAAWRAAAERLLLAAVARTGAAYALPAFALAEGQAGFLKKSPLRLDPEGARITLALAQGIPGPMGAAIREEAAALAAAAPDAGPRHGTVAQSR